MKQNSLQKFFVALLSTFLCSAAMYAQGIYQGSTRIDNISDFAIDAESTETLTFRFNPPIDGYPASITWCATGGIQIVGSSHKVASANWTSVPADYYEVKVKTLANDYSNGSASYNKYSKGRLTVRAIYDPNVCSCHCDYFDIIVSEGVSYSADIYKRFNPQNANGIAGQTCAMKGEEVTFSVEPWISNYSPGSLGFDEYTWSGYENIAKDGAIKYHSNDWSSITFDVSDDVESVEGTVIKCAVGKANTSKPLSITLTDAVAAPIVQYSYVADGKTITTDLKSDERLICVPIDVNTMTLSIKNYSELLSNGFSFEWSSEQGFQKTTAQLNASGATTFVADGGEHDVTLSVNGGNCGTSEFIYNVKRSLSNDAAIVFSKNNSICVPSNTSYGNVILDGVDASNKIQWGFVDEDTHGWAITENNGTQNTTQPYVKVGTTGITISANSYYCPSEEPIVQFLAINPSAPQLASRDIFCLEYKDYDASSAIKYEVKPDPLVMKWEWTFPEGWTAVDVENVEGKFTTYVNYINVIPNKSQSGTVTITSYGFNDCSGSRLITSSRFEYPKPELDIIDGCLNPGGEITMHLTEAEGFTTDKYYWDLNGITKSLNNGYNSQRDVTFTVLPDKGSASYTISVYPQGTCNVQKSKATYNIEIESPFYIHYEYKNRGSADKRKELLTVNSSDDNFYAHNVLFTVQRIQNNEVYYTETYNGDDELSLTYSNYKPGETVHIIADITIEDLSADDGNIGDEEVLILPCHTIYEFDFTIDTDAKGDLFKGNNKRLSITSMAEANEFVAYSLKDVKVYPNPTSGAITIELPAEDDYSLRVSDISGRIVAEQQGYGNTINVDLSGQSKGSYPFQLKTNIGIKSSIIILK